MNLFVSSFKAGTAKKTSAVLLPGCCHWCKYLHVARERLKWSFCFVEDRFVITVVTGVIYKPSIEFNQWCDVPQRFTPQDGLVSSSFRMPVLAVALSQKTTVKHKLSAWNCPIQMDPSLEGTNRNHTFWGGGGGGYTRCCRCNVAELETEHVTLQWEENMIVWSKPSFWILTLYWLEEYLLPGHMTYSEKVGARKWNWVRVKEEASESGFITSGLVQKKKLQKKKLLVFSFLCHLVAICF